MRNGKEEIDLSEMCVVRHTFPHKALDYILMYRRANHSQGGQSHDVIDQIRRYGIVPENVLPGMNIEEKRHNHGEMSVKGIFLLVKRGTPLYRKKIGKIKPRLKRRRKSLLL